MRPLHLALAALFVASLAACTPHLNAACSNDADCINGRCVDGVCREGCLSDANCADGYHCEEGACAPRQENGSTCGTDNDCMSNACVSGQCCNKACGPSEYCAAGTCQNKIAQGVACESGHPESCSTGHCVDGVCCNSACDDACDYCDVEGKEGQCSNAAGRPGTPACANHLVCGADSSSCPGFCASDDDCDMEYFCSPQSGQCEKSTGGAAKFESVSTPPDYVGPYLYGLAKLEWDVTIPARARRVLVVTVVQLDRGLFTNPDGSLADVKDQTVASVTYGGKSLTRHASFSMASVNGDAPHNEVWFLVDPPPGNARLVISNAASTKNYMHAGAYVFSNVDPMNPLAEGMITADGLYGLSTVASVTVPSRPVDIVVDLLGAWKGADLESRGADQEAGWYLCSDGAWRGASSYRIGAPLRVMSWTLTDGNPTIDAELYRWLLTAVTVRGNRTSATSCVDDSPCAGGKCVEGFCCTGDCFETKTPCSSSSQCASGFCSSDGVCCDTECAGSCQTCTDAGNVGRCKLRSAGATPSGCGAGYSCDGKSAECPTACMTSVTCAPGYFCDQTDCVALKANGQTCSGADGHHQCESGVCEDGVCCEQACGLCSQCNSQGKCAFIASGQDPASECTGDLVCDGSGGCRCMQDDDCASVQFCDAGACKAKQADGSTCAKDASCQSNQCADGKCCNGTCQILGSVCSTGTDCASGQCADGVCCNSACDGACNACDLTDHVGTCTVRTAGAQGSPSCSGYVCDGANAPCPTTCTATCASGFFCDGNKCISLKAQGESCSGPSACSAGLSCVDGICCNSACNGTCESCNLVGSIGTCVPVPDSMTESACGLYNCSGSKSECATACVDQFDCAANAYCLIPISGPATCEPQKADGQACLDGYECLSGACDTNSKCVTPCSDNSACPAGRSCDLATNVCQTN